MTFFILSTEFWNEDEQYSESDVDASKFLRTFLRNTFKNKLRKILVNEAHSGSQTK